jgi:hypothetical protein
MDMTLRMKSCQSHLSWNLSPFFFRSRFSSTAFLWVVVFSYISFPIISTFCRSFFLSLFPSLFYFFLLFPLPLLLLHYCCVSVFLLLVTLNVFISITVLMYSSLPLLIFTFFFICLFLLVFLFVSYFIFCSSVCSYFISFFFLPVFLSLSFPLVLFSVVCPVISYSF